MARRAYPVGSSAAAVVVPGGNDYDFTRFETNLLAEGVVQGVGSALAVVQRAAGANMSVDVGTGIALIQITNTNLSHGKTYKTWFELTAVENKTITVADGTNPRKDRVVLRIDVSVDPDGTASNIAIVEVLAGTPGVSPSAPAEPSNAITLAIVDVPASDTAITNGQITDSRTFVQLNTTVLADLARAADLASTADAKGANLVGVEDAEGDFTGTTVEIVLHELKALISPTGAITQWPTKTAPTGWLLCDGASISRSTYSGLFTLLVKSATVTVTIASPGVFTWTSHGLQENDPVKFTTTGALPTGITPGTTYYVRNVTTNTFNFAATPGGTIINTSGSQSGTHTGIHAPYGDGNGSTTFNVPSFIGRFALGRDLSNTVVTSKFANALGLTAGEENHTLTAAEMPSHTHSYTNNTANQNAGNTGSSQGGADVGATTGSAGSDGAHNNMPPYITTNFIIKT